MTRPAPIGRRWMTLFTLAWLVIWMAQLTPLQLLLPLQLDEQTSDDGDRWIYSIVVSGLILGIGGLVAVVAGPLAGAASDRTDGSSFPAWLGARRRPWALGGSWGMAVFLVLTGLAHEAWLVAICWIGVSASVAIASAAFTAMIPDQLPPDQRGAASASIGSSQALGIVLGVGVIVMLGLDVLPGYLVLATLVAVVGTWASLGLPDPAVPQSVRAARSEDRPWASLRDRDFCWMLGGRLVGNIGNALGTSLLLFFLLYGLTQEKADAENNLLILIVVYTIFVVGSSIVFGVISDRRGHRRTLTAVAACIQACAGVVIVAHTTFTATLIAAALMGIGYGAFMTTGLAFATDLLPHEEDHGRDLGIVNVSAALGQLLGPMLGAGLVAAVGGFWLVFVTGSVLSVAGGLMTLRAKEKFAGDATRETPVQPIA
ncbi:MFS transporter [Gordonia sp. (in: high G+C Gram-positive bacteria)]|uniref:MFS transporter n=1 Tax=Gordonia sp. (in: high G+C Gram-positive bacteria) TaxID=84139 RepID=UPI0016AEDAEE|nr:MFS transporter [Gordonia sp. (in: high G+C Gram-positive bacteria)]NLG46194.1 MFS transporter [Gordonia sp. (in: high G+C Gram-positive bacteria)]